jgi:predicted lysophospholipase L1 biosynthesis ABC-type transport system permease subunit
MSLALTIARRELRGGLKGFRVFLACLALGVAAIAAVGTLRTGIQQGLTDQGAVILGGDAEMRFTYRTADEGERAYMASIATRVSEVYDFRSMALIEDDQALTQVKAVDDGWPLTGAATLDPAIPVEEALGDQNGLPGALLDPVLIERLGLAIGDTFRLGTQEFRLSAALVREPDSASTGFALGPRTVVRADALANSGLLSAGSLYETRYRLTLPPDADLQVLEDQSEAAFRDKGMRWTDSRNAAPGIENFVDRIGSFLVLVGLAGLAVGGVGISSAIRSYLDGKVETIATLKTLGAEGGLIFRIYLWQTALLSAIGIAIGVALGAVVPVLAAPLIEASLPFPAEIRLAPVALLEAAFYGALSALIFTLLPLARTERIRPAALYRGGEGTRLAAQTIPRGAGRLGAGTDRQCDLAFGHPGACAGCCGRHRGRAVDPCPCRLWPSRAGAPAGAHGSDPRAACHPRGPCRHRRATVGCHPGDPVSGPWAFRPCRSGPDRLEPALGHRDRPADPRAGLLLRRHPARPVGAVPCAGDERPCRDRGGKRAHAARRGEPDQRPPRA